MKIINEPSKGSSIVPDDKRKKKSKTETGQPLDQILNNPKLNEAKGQTVVFNFGRLNPPTIGHQKLVRIMLEVARKERATPMLFLSHSEDPKKNPLPYKDKLFLAKKAFGPIVQESPAGTLLFQALAAASQKYSHCIWIAGSDRIDEYNRIARDYNGKDFNFESIKVMSAGQRDPDSEGAEGMSASKMRAAVKAGDMTAFKKGLPTKLKSVADQVFEMVKAGMKLSEELQLDERVLDIAQRRKRALTMRRYKTRIARARKIAARKMAGTDKLKKRAQRAAIKLVRKRVAGDKGIDYANLSTSDKIQIDKRVQARKSLINKLAKRLMPAVKRAEIERLKQQRSKKNESFDIDLMFEAYIAERTSTPQDQDIADKTGTQPARYHKGLKPSTKSARDAHFKKHGKKADDDPSAYKPAPGDASAETKPSKWTKEYQKMYGEDLGAVKQKHEREKDALKIKHAREISREKVRQARNEEYQIEERDLFQAVDYMLERLEMESTVEPYELLEEKGKSALAQKSEKSGISVGTLRKVYNRGVAAWKTGHRPGTTPQQWGYARVNAFIAKKKKGKLNHDTDLAHVDLDAQFDQFFREEVEVDEGVMMPSWLQKLALAPKMKKMVRIYLDWRRQNPGQGKKGVVQAVRMMGLDPRAANELIDTLNDMVAKGQMPKHLAIAEAVEIGADAAKAYAKATPMQKLPVELAVDGVPQKDGVIPKPEVTEKTLTPAEKKKREEIARAIERENPNMPMDQKMAIATAQAKKVAEATVPTTAQIRMARALKKHGVGKHDDFYKSKMSPEKRKEYEPAKRPEPAQVKKPEGKPFQWFKTGTLKKESIDQQFEDFMTEKYDLKKLGDNPGKFKRLVGKHLGAKAAEKIDGSDGTKIMAKAKKSGDTKLYRQGSFIKNFYGKEDTAIDEAFEATMIDLQCEECDIYSDLVITEAEYQGKKVTLNDPFRTPDGPKKFAVYTKNDKGNVVKVPHGDPNMEIKRDNPESRKNFRARHNCDNPGPKWKARYWSCYQWRAGAKVDN